MLSPAIKKILFSGENVDGCMITIGNKYCARDGLSMFAPSSPQEIMSLLSWLPPSIDAHAFNPFEVFIGKFFYLYEILTKLFI